MNLTAHTALIGLLKSHDKSGVIQGEHDPAVLAYAVHEHYVAALPNGVHLITVEGMGALEAA